MKTVFTVTLLCDTQESIIGTLTIGLAVGKNIFPMWLNNMFLNSTTPVDVPARKLAVELNDGLEVLSVTLQVILLTAKPDTLALVIADTPIVVPLIEVIVTVSICDIVVVGCSKYS